MDVSLAPRVADEEDAGDAGFGKGAPTNVLPTKSESSKKEAAPSGVVVSVLKRAWRERGYASSLDVGPGASGAAGRRAAADTSANPKPARVLVVPVDRRLPKIRVVTRQAPSIADQRIVVAIDDWPRDSAYPVGHYVKSLGPIGDADAETAAVLLEADVDDRPFAPAVHACVPPLPWRFEESEHLGPTPRMRREDHRALRVCSVDPPGCRDIDDALSCRVLETLDGDSNAPKTFELGAHRGRDFVPQAEHRDGRRGETTGTTTYW